MIVAPALKHGDQCARGRAGMRKSEQYGLIWKRVGFKRKQVHLGKPKNGDPRDVLMSATVLAAFQKLKFPNEKPTDRVFPILDSRPWFESAREKAEFSDFHWHDCRRTFCSRLAMAGIPLKTIRTLAGRKTVAITARYAHLAPSTLHAAVEMIRVPGYSAQEQSIPSRSRKALIKHKAAAKAGASIRQILI
jgi:integrase